MARVQEVVNARGVIERRKPVVGDLRWDGTHWKRWSGREAATVVLDGPSGVVLGYRRAVAHNFHAVMTLLTGGLWAAAWVASVLGRREDRVLLEADAWGNVWARTVATR